jgi:hypothetical protein
MHRATYCPEDNKLRFYPHWADASFDKETLKAAGYRWASKQEIYVAPRWTPKAEDAALEYVEDIEDEDYSPQERAADRAERFSGYRDKRRSEANGHADNFESGPAVHGYQSQTKADRAAARHDIQRVKAVSQWKKAEYWQERTEGVIENALYRSEPHVRRGRILEIERRLRQIEGVAGYDRSREHLNNRLIYERAMLENEGGIAGELEIVPGGWIQTHKGWLQIESVHKSPATGRVTSVRPVGWGKSASIKRAGEDVYRAPTPEELEQFAIDQKARKAERKATAPPKPSLINPTDEDAEKLQAVWNEQAREQSEGARSGHNFKPSEIIRMTQADYSDRSKGSYARFSAVEVGEKLMIRGEHRRAGRQRSAIFKVRRGEAGGYNYHAAPCVVILTDKPRKPLPFEVAAEFLADQPTGESLNARLGDIAAALKLYEWDRSEEQKQLLGDAIYAGLIYILSMTQSGWTPTGEAAFKAAQEATVTA